LYPTNEFSSQEQAVEAYKLLGISYVFEKEREEAEKQFLALLVLEPTFRLDALIYPNSVVEVFEEVKRRNEEKIKAILRKERREAEKRRQAELERKAELRRLAELAQRSPMVIERTVNEHPYWVNFVPLGAGQFQNGQQTKGYVLMGTQIGFGLLSAGTALGLYAAYPDLQVPTAERGTVRALTILQVTSGALCLVSVAYGIVDAVIYHQPRSVRERRYQQEPEEDDQGTAFFLTPTAGKAGAGLELGFTF
jgi:hypothetical protein